MLKQHIHCFKKRANRLNHLSLKQACGGCFGMLRKNAVFVPTSLKRNLGQCSPTFSDRYASQAGRVQLLSLNYTIIGLSSSTVAALNSTDVLRPRKLPGLRTWR